LPLSNSRKWTVDQGLALCWNFRGEIYYVVDEALKVTVQDAATGQTRAQLGPIIDPELLRLAPDGSAIAALVDSKSIGIWRAYRSRGYAA
jgi:hypothetical protein